MYLHQNLTYFKHKCILLQIQNFYMLSVKLFVFIIFQRKAKQASERDNRYRVMYKFHSFNIYYCYVVYTCIIKYIILLKYSIFSLLFPSLFSVSIVLLHENVVEVKICNINVKNSMHLS